jgi:hypothetical protein
MKTIHEAHLEEIEYKGQRLGPWPPAWLTAQKSIGEAGKETVHAYGFGTQLPQDTKDQAWRKIAFLDYLALAFEVLQEGYGEWKRTDQ